MSKENFKHLVNDYANAKQTLTEEKERMLEEYEAEMERLSSNASFSSEMSDKLEKTYSDLKVKLEKVGLVISPDKITMYGNYVRVFLYPTEVKGFVPVEHMGYNSKGDAKNEKSLLSKSEMINKIFRNLGYEAQTNKYSVENSYNSKFTCVIVELKLKRV